MSADYKFTGLKTPLDVRVALESAAKFYGCSISQVVIRWVRDRARAEGWMAPATITPMIDPAAEPQVLSTEATSEAAA